MGRPKARRRPSGVAFLQETLGAALWKSSRSPAARSPAVTEPVGRGNLPLWQITPRRPHAAIAGKRERSVRTQRTTTGTRGRTNKMGAGSSNGAIGRRAKDVRNRKQGTGVVESQRRKYEAAM